MARPKNVYPTYRKHKSSGTARCWVNGSWLNLGKYDSPESHREFNRIVAEFSASAGRLNRVNIVLSPDITVDEVMLGFLRHAERYYRREDGTPTTELDEIKRSVAMVRRIYGGTAASKFGPLSLEAVREQMIQAGWCRKLINKRVGRIKRMFRWAASRELIASEVYGALRLLEGLTQGRTTARESPRVTPVEPTTVVATLPFFGRHLRAMVELQRLTGMRPGEVCAIELAEIDRSTEPWTYRPRQHKTLHRGKTRLVMIGPRGRAVIEEFVAGGFVVDPSGPLFSPRRAREERFEMMRAKRKSAVQPSQKNRRKAKPKLLPAEEYTPHTYAHAVRVAAKKAGAAHWHPNQLRHLYASEVRKDHGLEAAQVLLGHSRADITQVYAERDLALAAKIALQVG